MNENTDQPITYHIKTVTDFLAVPEDRRDVCIHEFYYWCATINAMKELVDAMELPVETPDVYTWIDDGKHTMKGVLINGTEDYVILDGVIPGFSGDAP